ncbi:MAG: GNAT family N-acetyltransferase [Sinimarinibacterium sp.]
MMHAARMAVTENRLVSSVITEADYVPAIEGSGRGWVIEADDRIVGFATGNAANGNIWALFVEPGHDKRGYGRQLLDALVAWLWSQGLQQLWLTTAPGTRAQHFYEAAGWQHAGVTAQGELRFELHRPEGVANAAACFERL